MKTFGTNPSLRRRRDWLLNLVRPLARWLRCKDSMVKYFSFCSAITSLTGRMFKSLCMFPVIVLRIFDWARCTMSMVLFLAFPHNWEPYIQIGFSTDLYSRTLYSRLRGNRALISQWRLLAFSCSFGFNVPAPCESSVEVYS